jgi:hypothetical protein
LAAASQIETLFNIVVLRVTEFRQLFNANEVALIPPVLVDLGPTLLKFDIGDSEDRPAKRAVQEQRQLVAIVPEGCVRGISGELHHTDGDVPEQIRDGDFVSVT